MGTTPSAEEKLLRRVGSATADSPETWRAAVEELVSAVPLWDVTSGNGNGQVAGVRHKIRVGSGTDGKILTSLVNLLHESLSFGPRPVRVGLGAGLVGASGGGGGDADPRR